MIRVDLESFFSSISAPRIYGVLRTAGYPEAVAYTITGLCTTVVPQSVWQAVRIPEDFTRHRRLGQLPAVPQLPPGAPTSPALANLVESRSTVASPVLPAHSTRDTPAMSTT